MHERDAQKYYIKPMNVLVFDIETIPDPDIAKTILNTDGLTDNELIQVLPKLYKNQKNQNSNDFLPHYMHRVIAISVLLQTSDAIKLWSLGTATSSEYELLSRFYEGLEKFKPKLISWNGTRFDLPVLHYRALKHKIGAAFYWDQGTLNPDFKYNNYINRYHERHLDVMDVIAGYNSQAWAPLDEIAQLIGLPGKMILKGNEVAEAFIDNRIEDIRHYCEIDVLNTYLIYLQFECLRGHHSLQSHQSSIHQLIDTLSTYQKPHLNHYIETIKKSFGASNK